MAKRSKKEGWKAKKWYNVLAPEMFGHATIGETPTDEPKKLIGKIMTTTLGEMTDDWSKKNINMLFKIYEVDANGAQTIFIGHEMARDYMRSLVKRRTSKIDANIIATTPDGYKVRVKPSCFTVRRASHPQIKTIRQMMHDIVTYRAKELDFTAFIQEIVLGKISSDIYKVAKDIYPLRRVEVRKTEIVYRPKEVVKIEETQAVG
ncbi:MAG TPA: 30S ribosomal protein S3ae [Methanocellales archaeon]|nr:30S ribosomal protein S3ae [Methanocellales archaeon]